MIIASLLSLAIEEKWIDITGFEGRYQISSLGRVKSLGRQYAKHSDKILKFRVAGLGYHQASLFKNSIETDIYVHVLVARHFIPNPNNYPQVNHMNGIKTDNRVENLEWCTQSHNILHAYRTGLHKSKNKAKGDNHWHSRLKGTDVLKIREMGKAKDKPPNHEIGKIFNVSACTIQGILSRKAWKHIQ